MEARIARYVIPGEPVPWARPSGMKWRYDTQKHLKLVYGIHIREQHKGALFEGPLHLHIVFFMPLSKKLSQKKAQLQVGKFHPSRPDFSNMLKLIEDCCTGIVYKDDSLIAKLSGEKVYDRNPRTEFTITELR